MSNVTPKRYTKKDTKKKIPKKIYTEKKYYKKYYTIESCFSCPAASAKKKENHKKIQDTNVATSWRGVAWPETGIGSGPGPVLASPTQGNWNSWESVATVSATSVTTANNVSERYASSSRYRYIYTARNYSAPSSSLPALSFSPFSLSLLPFINCAWPTLLARNCNRCALFL